MQGDVMRKIVSAAVLGALFAGSAAMAQQAAPTNGRGIMIPAPVAMREMTPEEEQAHQLWSLRAALNVAALQCQFSPYLATVRNYNDMLRHHSDELDKARRAVTAHFTRYEKANGTKAAAQKTAAQKQFDQYTTKTYNSFSTLDAQLPFCEKAGEIGREALTRPKGGLASLAALRLGEIRASLVPQPDRLMIVDQLWLPIPLIENPCLDKKGRRKKKCK